MSFNAWQKRSNFQIKIRNEQKEDQTVDTHGNQARNKQEQYDREKTNCPRKMQQVSGKKNKKMTRQFRTNSVINYNTNPTQVRRDSGGIIIQSVGWYKNEILNNVCCRNWVWGPDRRRK